MIFLTKKRSAITIQRIGRGKVIRRLLTLKALAATKIQSPVRGSITRNAWWEAPSRISPRRELIQKPAAISIQCALRSMVARVRVGLLRESRLQRIRNRPRTPQQSIVPETEESPESFDDAAITLESSLLPNQKCMSCGSIVVCVCQLRRARKKLSLQDIWDAKMIFKLQERYPIYPSSDIITLDGLFEVSIPPGVARDFSVKQFDSRGRFDTNSLDTDIPLTPFQQKMMAIVR